MVLCDLVARRVPPGPAVQSLAALVSIRATGAQLNALRTGVERDIDAGNAVTAVVLRDESEHRTFG